jgi:DNA replication licensing factor MCM7
MYVTPRTLLGIIRLSQSLAKLHFRSEVIQNDVDEAIRLMDFSFRSLQRISGNERERRKNVANHREEEKMATVMRTVRAIINENQQHSLAINEIFKRMRKHRNETLTNVEELKEIMRYYAKLHVVFIDDDEQVSLL